MRDRGMAESPRAALGVDIPNHLVPLTPLGRRQASETRDFFQYVDPDVVYTSQLWRAEETARIIFPGREMRIDPRLNEKDFGPAHMMGDQELREAWPHHVERYGRDGKYFAAKAPGAENYIDMFLRAHGILDTLRRDWAGKTVVVVCHSAIMMSFRQLLERHSPAELLALSRQQHVPNCGFMLYTRSPRGPLGFERGKFRLHLAKVPTKVWEDYLLTDQQLWDLAMTELVDLRTKFAD